MKKYFFIAIAMFLSVAVVSCKKDEVTVSEDVYASLIVEFDHLVGERKLQLNTNYKNGNNETYSINDLRYFVSNIQLTNANGSVYTVAKDSSFFLIDVTDKESLYAKLNIPEGDYTNLTFVLGIDSLTNTLPLEQRTGILDPAVNNMYWTWNSGYIFFKMEGESDAVTALDKKFRYHIGGFGGYSSPTINNIKKISIDLNTGGVAKVRKDRNSTVHLFVDVAKVFDGENSISLAANANVMFSEFSVKIANNYASMFTHDHTHN